MLFRLLRILFSPSGSRRRRSRSDIRPARPLPDRIRNPYVVDGDTIHYRGHRIRLFGMDAPEMNQLHGRTAKDALARFIGHGTIKVEQVGMDPYGRTVARLYRDDADLCRMMVAYGYAISYRGAYRIDEAAARSELRGLWARGGIFCPTRHRRKYR